MRRCGWSGCLKIKIFLWILMPLCLAGCANRELEDRSFPSAMVVREAGIEASMEEQQNQSRLYLDYGHVKAVLINKALVPDIQNLKEILAYLEKRPVFARNILVFAAEDDVLEAAQARVDEIGPLLEDLYKNQPKGKERQDVALADMLNFWHNHEAAIEVPVLILKEGDIILDDSVTVENGAVPTLGTPVAAKAGE